MRLTEEPVAPEFLAMSEEEQIFLRALAEEFIGMLENTEREMARKFAGQLFDLDEGNALWGLLPAKVRTAIRRGGMTVGSKCAECQLVGTHTRQCSVGGRFA